MSVIVISAQWILLDHLGRYNVLTDVIIGPRSTLLINYLSGNCGYVLILIPLPQWLNYHKSEKAN